MLFGLDIDKVIVVTENHSSVYFKNVTILPLIFYSFLFIQKEGVRRKKNGNNRYLTLELEKKCFTLKFSFFC